MRRQLDLAVEDFILADVAIADERICGLVSTGWKAGIADEVRARSSPSGGMAKAGRRCIQLAKDWDVEGIAMTIGISKAA